jgi:hypothetical protein
MGDLTKNLSRSEFACQCEYSDCDRTPVDFELPTIIQDCADHFAYLEKGHSPMFTRIAIHINSGYRCVKHNDDVTDGEGSGIHTLGMAADHWMEYVYADGTRRRVSDDDIAEYYERRYPDQYGIGRYPRNDNTGRTHFDTRDDNPARWTA